MRPLINGTNTSRHAVWGTTVAAMACLSGAMHHSAQAATINWGTPTTISGPTDVDTSGTLVGAFNFDDDTTSTTTINGQDFVGVPLDAANIEFEDSESNVVATLATSDNYNPSAGWIYNVIGDPQVEGGTGDPDYDELVRDLLSNVTGNNASWTLTLEGLTVSSPYVVQFWAQQPGVQDRNVVLTAGNNVSLDVDTGDANRNGQFVTGSFIADATTQDIVISGLTDSGAAGGFILNGFQVRLVPEPGSAILLSLGGLLLAARSRQVRRF